MDRIQKASFLFVTAVIVLTGILKLGTLLLTVLFSFLLLRGLLFTRRKWVATLVFVVVVAMIFEGFVIFVDRAIEALPAAAAKSIPLVVQYARDFGYDLPFSDLDSLKIVAADEIRTELIYLANFAKIATKEFLFLIFGLVVAVSMFLSREIHLGTTESPAPNDLYTRLTGEIRKRFWTFYLSFEQVMGAQIIISAINTALTSIFVLTTDLPYPGVVIVITFLCGLLPVIGNLISNTIIVGIALTVSPKLAIASLLFLVAIHKLEYFLNSKIIGTRIRNPMWLTLLGLIVGERLMGIPGMILASVVLNYFKVEASQISLDGSDPALPRSQ